MAQLPRYVLVGQPQRVIVRGNNREPVFYADEDYRFYLETLKKACSKHQCDVHAYVLMTNHVHLLITPNKKINGVKSMGSDSIDFKRKSMGSDSIDLRPTVVYSM